MSLSEIKIKILCKFLIVNRKYSVSNFQIKMNKLYANDNFII